MSKNLQRRAYSESEFKDADRLGKIKIHITDPDYFHLSPRDEEYLCRIRRCFILTSECYTQQTLLARLHEEFETLSARSLNQLIQDSKSFYGDFELENKKFNWLAQQQRLLRKLESIDKELKPNFIEQDGEKIEVFHEAKDLAALYKESINLEKLLKTLRDEMPDTEDGIADLPPSRILFDDNPALLAKGGYFDIEDAEIIEGDEEEE